MRYRWSPYVESVEMDGEWVILNPEQFTVAKLNDVGGFIWSKLKEPMTKENIVAEVLDEYDSTVESVEVDVDAFLSKLVERKAVEVVE